MLYARIREGCMTRLPISLLARAGLYAPNASWFVSTGLYDPTANWFLGAGFTGLRGLYTVYGTGSLSAGFTAYGFWTVGSSWSFRQFL